MKRRLVFAAFVVVVLTAPVVASAAVADPKEAKKEREKPLQRCDELKDKAQLECLAKARERVLEARKKREEKAAKGK